VSNQDQDWMTDGFRLDQWIIDPAHGRFETSGHRLHIEPKVMDVLLCLARRHGQVVTRAELLDEVWNNFVVSEEVLTRCISELRTALNDTHRERRFIRTIPKRGYSLIIKPEPLDHQQAEPICDEVPANSGEPQLGFANTAGLNSAEELMAETSPEHAQATRAGPSKSLWQRWFGQETIAAVIVLAIFMVYKWGSKQLEETTPAAPAPMAAVAPAVPAAGVSPVGNSQALDVAVLPFENISSDGSDDYFSVGLAEDIRNKLIRTKGLRVAGRTSSEIFLDKAMDIRAIGESLNARTVLEGTVRMDETRIRLTVQLSAADNGHPIWAETYERDRVDVFALQEKIASDVVKQLAPALSRADSQPDTELLPNSVQAYDNYLLGRFQWNKRTPESIERAQLYFQRAIDLDPQYAAAYSGMADSILVAADYNSESHDGKLSAAETERVETLIKKALSLNPDDSEANASRGLLAQMQDDSDTADAYLRRALEFNPNNSMARMWLGNLKMKEGYPNQAFEQLKYALNLDPLHPAIQTNYLSTLTLQGKSEEVLEIAPYFYKLTGNDTNLLYQMNANVDMGHFADALEVASSHTFSGHLKQKVHFDAALALMALGHFEDAERVIASVPDNIRLAGQFYDVKGHLALAKRDTTELKKLMAEVAPKFDNGEFNECDRSFLLRYQGILAWMEHEAASAEESFRQSMALHAEHCHDLITNNLETTSYLIKVANFREQQSYAQELYQQALSAIEEAEANGIQNSLNLAKIKLHTAMGDFTQAKIVINDLLRQDRNPYGWLITDPMFDDVIDQLFDPPAGTSEHPAAAEYRREQLHANRIQLANLKS